MSLQIWLPLNGNLQQQGLSSVNATMMGTGITYSAGKIGQAATFPNDCNSCIYLPSLRLQTGTYAAWIKVIGAGGTARQCIISEGRDSSNDGVEIYTNQAGTSLNFKAHEKIITTTISLNQWYHVAGTFGNGEVKLYINGTLVGSNTYITDMSYQYASNLVLGKMSYSYTNTSNYFAFNGQLNDVRIYDYALSVKEVEEISKGLVLHYKLDNNINQTNWLLPNFETTIVRASENSFTDYEYYTDLIASTETNYIVDFYAKGSVDAMGMDVYFRNSSGSAYALTSKQILTTDWKHYSLSLSGSPSSLTLFRARCYGGTANDVIYIRNMKLFSNNMPIKDTIVYDSSGYNNNGTIIGSLKTISPSPRYNYAIQFDGSSSTIKVLENKWIVQYAQAMTINLWVKNTTWNNGANMKFFSCTESGGFNCEPGNSGYVRFPIHVCTDAAQISYAYKYDSKEIQASALIANKWNMITWVYDTNGTKTYINGQLHHTYTNTSYGIHFNTNARLFLGCEAAGANPSTPYYNGQMSDFRMYYTALSPEAILELYNTSATIDNKGNIYARELVEE